MVESNRFNLVVRAEKTLRFSLLQGAPDWLAILINYLTPVIGGIWMDRAVQTGAWNAIHLASGVPGHKGSAPTKGPRGWWSEAKGEIRWNEAGQLEAQRAASRGSGSSATGRSSSTSGSRRKGRR